mmetsp:Transcript_18064/g.50119  ORF Transcript_18064/g.50119 Transcript_18064/m.50119 type:complete len:114 (+) Transcript_18064:1814-2155(+)
MYELCSSAVPYRTVRVQQLLLNDLCRRAMTGVMWLCVTSTTSVATAIERNSDHVFRGNKTFDHPSNPHVCRNDDLIIAIAIIIATVLCLGSTQDRESEGERRILLWRRWRRQR